VTREIGRLRLRASAAIAAVGAAPLLGAALSHAGSAGSVAKGGTMRLNISATDLDFSDPSLAYGSVSWQIEYATALKLVNYPDRPAPRGSRFVPEAAAALPVISGNGQTYTFTIRKGLRFSNGTPVTAGSFKWAFDRSATRAQQSPAVAFMDSVVGYRAAFDSGQNPADVSGVTARGNTLVIRLNRPDGAFLSKLAMPFFQAVSTNTQVDPHGVTAYPTAGPY
jgi:peptide/nickel transport system substrate-binding protein